MRSYINDFTVTCFNRKSRVFSSNLITKPQITMVFFLFKNNAQDNSKLCWGKQNSYIWNAYGSPLLTLFANIKSIQKLHTRACLHAFYEKSEWKNELKDKVQKTWKSVLNLKKHRMLAKTFSMVVLLAETEPLTRHYVTKDYAYGGFLLRF